MVIEPKFDVASNFSKCYLQGELMIRMDISIFKVIVFSLLRVEVKKILTFCIISLLEKMGLLKK